MNPDGGNRWQDRETAGGWVPCREAITLNPEGFHSPRWKRSFCRSMNSRRSGLPISRGYTRKQAAERMNVSRQTFGRIVETARRKVAEALVEGKALKIEGGEVEMASMRRFRCDGCKHSWEIPYGTGKPGSCPACESGNVHRAEEDRGSAGGYGRRQGRCSCGDKKNNSKKGENS